MFDSYIGVSAVSGFIYEVRVLLLVSQDRICKLKTCLDTLILR